MPGDISHFQALMTALAATIGTGNIAGVATAVVLGGPGTIFWMWMTALVGIATKSTEGLLAIIYRVKDKKGNYAGGPMYYPEHELNMQWLDIPFAFLGKDGATGAALTTLSFDALLPGWGGLLVTIGLIFFAYSTVLGWSYYS
jgi:AGCS family alanine or glycine:cation symporter